MKRSLPFAIVAVLIAVAMLACSSATSSGNAAHVDPAVVGALEQAPQAYVLISLKQPDLPSDEWTLEIQRQNAAERQARVLAALDESEFELLRQFERSAALSGLLTEQGLDELRKHGDVVAIDLAVGGDLEAE